VGLCPLVVSRKASFPIVHLPTRPPGLFPPHPTQGARVLRVPPDVPDVTVHHHRVASGQPAWEDRNRGDDDWVYSPEAAVTTARLQPGAEARQPSLQRTVGRGHQSPHGVYVMHARGGGVVDSGVYVCARVYVMYARRRGGGVDSGVYVCARVCACIEHPRLTVRSTTTVHSGSDTLVAFEKPATCNVHDCWMLASRTACTPALRTVSR